MVSPCSLPSWSLWSVLPDVCSLKTILSHVLPSVSVSSRSRTNPVPFTLSQPEAEVSYFLNTKVFPKLGCVQSSEKLIKNKDSWASSQKSWCWRAAWESVFYPEPQAMLRLLCHRLTCCLETSGSKDDGVYLSASLKWYHHMDIWFSRWTK
jgi:hypothetical protein